MFDEGREELNIANLFLHVFYFLIYIIEFWLFHQEHRWDKTRDIMKKKVYKETKIKQREDREKRERKGEREWREEKRKVAKESK